MITADPKTIGRAFKLISGEQAIEVPRQVRLSDSSMTWPYKLDDIVPRRFFVSVADASRLTPMALWACLRATRGGAFVLVVARVADELAQAEVKDGATALEIARRVIAHQLAAGEADVQPGAASAVALLALQVNGLANLAALADLGELRDPPLTLGEP
jgi:hypothetical protein